MKEITKTKKIVEIEEALKTALDENNFTLVDIEISEDSDFITIYIFSSQDSTVDRIGKISKILYPILEKIPFLNRGFSLEVSSPGLYRIIKNKQEFSIFKGREIKVTDEEGNTVCGILKNFENDTVTVLTKEKKEINLIFDKIKKASLNG